ncbi:unnamed protein product [Sphagnum balticum]
METSELALRHFYKAGARKTPFQTKHAIQYGLSITTRDPMSSEVVAVRCQFCICFGCKGSSKKSLMTWTFEGPPFQIDNYTQHLCLNHKTRWEEYQGLAHQEKSKYFDVAFKHAETICHYIEPRSEAITLTISSNIVDVVIGDMLWHPTDMEGQTRENALSLFKRKEDVAFDASTELQQTSWVDVRIRYYQNSALGNLHLITLPFAGRHTGLATFEMFEKLFDDVYPLWKDKLIGCSMDRAANMTGHLSGVVTWIQNVVKPNFMRVWCLLHQIDIIMQKVYKRGIFASQILDALEPEECTEVLDVVGEILLSIVNGLSLVEALRDKVNDASTDGMPPCLSHEL